MPLLALFDVKRKYYGKKEVSRWFKISDAEISRVKVLQDWILFLRSFQLLYAIESGLKV